MRKSLSFTPFVLMVFFLISAQVSYAITSNQFQLTSTPADDYVP
jgi:hypothetical protein